MAAHGQLFIERDEEIPAQTIGDYYILSRNRFNRWMKDLTDLENGLSIRNPLHLIGLMPTRPATRTIAEQILVGSGARPLLQWTHQYRRMRWEHRTEGTSALLSRASTGWPTVLAHHIQDALGGNRQDAKLQCESGSCRLDGKSPGMLVSWAFEVGEKLS